MPQFRKKPVVVEAFQMTEERADNKDGWPKWLYEAWNKLGLDAGSLTRGSAVSGGLLSITTLGGRMTVDWNDWIIRGVKGELYPCKPDIFEAMYERVED